MNSAQNQNQNYNANQPKNNQIIDENTNLKQNINVETEEINKPNNKLGGMVELQVIKDSNNIPNPTDERSNFKENVQKEKSKVNFAVENEEIEGKENPQREKISLNRVSTQSRSKEWVINEEVMRKCPKENATKIRKMYKCLDPEGLDNMRKKKQMDFDENYYKRVKNYYQSFNHLNYFLA